MGYVTGAIAIVVILVVVVFSIQNLAAVEVSFLFWSANLPKVALILGTYALGMFTGWGLLDLLKRVWS